MTSLTIPEDLATPPARRLTILCTAFNAVGHMNAVAGATKALMERGHRMIFLVEKSFADKFHPLGYEEHVYSSKPDGDNSEPEKSGEWLANYLLQNKIIGPYTVEEKLINLRDFFAGPDHVAEFARYDAAVKNALELYKPDLVYYDYGALVPSLYFSNVPWVRNISIAPSFSDIYEDVPPGGTGLSSTSDRAEWARINKLKEVMFASEEFQRNFVLGIGYPSPYPGNRLYPDTCLMTVYAYPQELNYPEFARRQDWFNLEVFQHNYLDFAVQLTQLIPEKFMLDDMEDRFSGKYIYVTLGSMGSVDLNLMRRLVQVLGKTQHKYIVSKGPRASEYQLPANMWGDDYLPQTKILPLVDLVITHGGNNTFTETFSVGKPMLVLPLFGDQFDNAQRITELGYGSRLDPYNCTDDQLTSAVESLLYNEQLSTKLRLASDRILASSRHELLARKIEQLAVKN